MVNRMEALMRKPEGAADDSSGLQAGDALQMALAALLVQAGKQDGNFDSNERATVAEILERQFNLSRQEIDVLMTSAEGSTDGGGAELERLTMTISAEMEDDERLAVVDMLWEVVYADGLLHPYEEKLVRSVARMLGVDAADRDAAQARVKADLGIEG